MPAKTLASRPSSKTSISQSAKSCAVQPHSQVVLYARVSSKDQEKEGFSIPAQQRLLREYALEKGLVIAQE
jgi:predicted site-specific integrase-resolvase